MGALIISVSLSMVVCVVLDLSLPPDLKFEASGTDKIKKNEIIWGVNSCMLPSFFCPDK